MKNTRKNKYFFLLVSCLLTALFVAAPAFGQEDKTGEIDKIFSWSKPDAPGCVIAASQNGKLIVNRAYGSADLERDVPLNTNSIFDIASVRKQFVAASVLLLVEDKRLSLSDDVRKYFPELPDYGQKITIDHLLTHTSGIRDWTGLTPLAGGNADLLLLILRQRGLNFAPGEEWSYSNSGYVLLTELVARASGMSFGDFTRKRLFEPLGMKTTAYGEEPLDVVKNRALGYEKEGKSWKIGVLLGKERGRGSGAILSTASDLVIWNDALTNNRLGAYLTEKLQEPAKLNNGRKLGYARGLNVDACRGAAVVSHSGGAAGYSAWLGRFPAHGLSIAVLCNADETSATGLARRVGDLFLPVSAGNQQVENDVPPPIVPAGIDVSGKTGLFFNERTGESMSLSVDRGRFRVDGGPGLVAVTNDRFRRWRASVFFMSQDAFEVNFLSPNEFELKSMEGKTTMYRRAQAFAPTAADLQAFAGRFTNEETRGVFEIAPGKTGLMIRLNDSQPFEFRPVDRDTFQMRGMILRFQRDKTGKVVGFDHSNPLVRSIKFTRLSDR